MLRLDPLQGISPHDGETISSKIRNALCIAVHFSSFDSMCWWLHHVTSCIFLGALALAAGLAIPDGKAEVKTLEHLRVYDPALPEGQRMTGKTAVVVNRPGMAGLHTSNTARVVACLKLTLSNFRGFEMENPRESRSPTRSEVVGRPVAAMLAKLSNFLLVLGMDQNFQNPINLIWGYEHV